MNEVQLSMFVMPIHDPAKPMAQCFDEDLELAVLCEELGYRDFWVGEHHSSTYENIVMPEIFLGKVLGLTSSLRIGPAPVCLQYHNPVHVASRLAFLDHLSHGRLNVCFGPGAVPTDMEVYGVDPKDTGARVAEAIEMIMKIWTTDPPYELKGRFWEAELSRSVDLEMGIGGLHKPFQLPTPPIYVPSISARSPGLRAASTRGFNFISHHMIHRDVLREQWITYQQAAEEAGRVATPSNWSVSRNIFVAETTAEAKALARSNSLGRCLDYILELTDRTSPTGIQMWKRDQDQPTEDCNLDYFIEDVVIAGDPDEVTRKLLELREGIGDFGTLVNVAHDWDDRGAWQRSLELLSREVMPAINSAIASARV